MESCLDGRQSENEWVKEECTGLLRAQIPHLWKRLHPVDIEERNKLNIWVNGGEKETLWVHLKKQRCGNIKSKCREWSVHWLLVLQGPTSTMSPVLIGTSTELVETAQEIALWLKKKRKRVNYPAIKHKEMVSSTVYRNRLMVPAGVWLYVCVWEGCVVIYYHCRAQQQVSC